MKTNEDLAGSSPLGMSLRKLAILAKILVKNGERVSIQEHNTQTRRRRHAFQLQYRVRRKFHQIPGGASQRTAGMIFKLDSPHGSYEPAVNWLRLFHIRTSSEKVYERLLPFISRMSDGWN